MDPSRFQAALAIALTAHSGQVRKGTEIPYISHPIGVASLVMEDEGSDDEIAAALLHDVVEDAGSEYAEPIRQALGDDVLAIVLQCSDSVQPSGTERDPWKDRKVAYLGQIPTKSASAIRVTTADKLHNARAILTDLHASGPEVFERFSGKKSGTLWYYGAVTEALAAHPSARPRLVDELRRTVDAMLIESFLPLRLIGRGGAEITQFLWNLVPSR